MPMDARMPMDDSPPIVLAPVLQPGSGLLALISDLHDAAPGADVVVVDDGSGPAAAPILDDAAGRGCTVLRHDTNRGKGAALKTGFRHIAATVPGRAVVCADADGQHSVADVLRVADRVRATGRMVLGVREFDGAVPLRSRVGNVLTGLLFRAATGHPVRDTQTGLRGYPSTLLGWLGTVPGEHFEYEMDILLHATRDGLEIEQVTIETTYAPGNTSSHFGSLSDSARVYRALLRFAMTARTSR